MAGHQHTGEAGCTHQLPAATAGPGCPGPRYCGAVVEGAGRGGGLSLGTCRHRMRKKRGGSGSEAHWLASLWEPPSAWPTGHLPAQTWFAPLREHSPHLCPQCHFWLLSLSRTYKMFAEQYAVGRQLHVHTLSPPEIFSPHAVLPFWV